MISPVEFKQWFQGSVVVDDDGNPLVMHHGTLVDIDKFRTQPFDFDSVYAGDIGQGIIGAFFSSSREVAKSFPPGGLFKDRHKIIEVYLSILKPKKFSSLNAVKKDIQVVFGEQDVLGVFSQRNRVEAVQILSMRYKDHLVAKGYDGIMFKEGKSWNTSQDKSLVYVAFWPEQIMKVDDVES